MTAETRVVYVPLRMIYADRVELVDAAGARRAVRGPGSFAVVGDRGLVCCEGLVLEASHPEYRVRFRSGEELVVRIDDAKCLQGPDAAPAPLAA